MSNETEQIDDDVKWQVPMERNKHGLLKYYLDGDIKDKFFELYPITSNKELAKIFGISTAIVQKFGKRYQLKKDMATIEEMRIKRCVTTRRMNGTYFMSEKNKTILRKLIAEGKNFSFRRMKEQNPEAFKKMVERRAKTYKETRRKEERRAVLGLPRKTKLTINLNPKKRRATMHKYIMVHEYNYFAVPEHSDWVCYDSQTKRSAQREATAIKLGLQIVQADED